MKKNFLPFLIALVALCSLQSTINAQNNFGVLVNDGSTEHQIAVGKALGVSYMRTNRNFSNWQDDSKYRQLTNAGFKILLNVNYSEQEKEPRPYPTDMNEYRNGLTQILSKYRPQVVVIENEEANQRYYIVNAQQYLAELKTAVEVAHSKGLLVTNGGLTMPYLRLLVWQDYMNRGMTAQANDFANRTFIGMPHGSQAIRNNPKLREQMDIANQLIAGYKNLAIDYINFHWYEPISEKGKADAQFSNTPVNTQDIQEVVEYLERATGKPVMTNESGVLNESPDWTASMLQTFSSLNLKYICWYSTDGGEGKAVALQNTDGSLRSNGQSFASFVRQHQ